MAFRTVMHIFLRHTINLIVAFERDQDTQRQHLFLRPQFNLPNEHLTIFGLLNKQFQSYLLILIRFHASLCLLFHDPL